MKLKNHHWAYVLSSTLLIGCASKSYETPAERWTPPPVASPAPEIRIDYIGLQHTLGLDRASDDLGYQEKNFSTCEAGNGYSHSDNCRQMVFVLIHFQLACRSTEASPTSEVSESDIMPISSRRVDWTLAGTHGQSNTDSQGYAQLRGAFNKSAKEQRLKINIGREFLYMEAGDITRVVAPPSWCQRL